MLNVKNMFLKIISCSNFGAIFTFYFLVQTKNLHELKKAIANDNKMTAILSKLFDVQMNKSLLGILGGRVGLLFQTIVRKASRH